VATVFALPVRPAGTFEPEPEAAADGEAEVLAAEAAALADEAEALAEAEDAVEAGGVEVVELDELHAASARQLAVAATARKLMGRMFIRNMAPEDRLMLATRLEEGKPYSGDANSRLGERLSRGSALHQGPATRPWRAERNPEPSRVLR
jgi:hypothetical protein